MLTLVFSHSVGKPNHNFSREGSKAHGSYWEPMWLKLYFVKINASAVTRIDSTGEAKKSIT